MCGCRGRLPSWLSGALLKTREWKQDLRGEAQQRLSNPVRGPPS